MIRLAGRWRPAGGAGTSAGAFGRVLALAVIAAGLLAGSSCTDPVHDGQVSALGGEDPGIPQGEYHRAGQPCTVCHGPEGPASSQFSLAGTIFVGPTCRVGAPNAEIIMIDADGTVPPGILATNCVGNFLVRQEIWAPAFPILAWVRQGNLLQKMVSHVSRETSCNQCHQDPRSDNSPGHIYMNETEPDSYTVSCPFNPIVPTNGCPTPTVMNTYKAASLPVAEHSQLVAAAADVSAPVATPSDPPMFIWTSPGSAGAALPPGEAK